MKLGLLLLLIPTSLYAQPQISTGKLLEFYHGVDQFILTRTYQLCVDAVSDAACFDISVQAGSLAGWYQFPLPPNVTAGTHFLGVRAIGFTSGPTGVSNALQVVVNPPPGTLTSPSNFRIIP